MRRRFVIAFGGALLAASVVAPAHASSRSVPSDWAAHDAAVRALHTRGYLIGDQARYDALKAAASARAHPGSGTGSPATATTPAPSPSFGGVADNRLAPSDSTGAVSPKRYIEAINIKMAIYSKTGGTIATGDPTTIVNTGPLDLSDPQVIWDKITNRFYFLYLDTKDDTYRWAFSKTATPSTVTTSDWCGYTTDLGYGSNLPDYPKMGQTAGALIISANVYATQAYIGSDLASIQKPAGSGPITTCPANNFKTSIFKALKNPDGTPFASDLEPGVQANPGTTAWVAGVPDATNSGAVGNFIDLFTVTEKPDHTISVDAGTKITVPSYSPPAAAPQKGTNALLDTLDGRLTHAVTDVDPSIAGSNHPALWTSHTIAGGSGAEVRWYEVDVLAKSLKQEGDITDPSLFVFNGAVTDDRAVNSNKFGSNMIAGLTTSSVNSFPANQSVVKLGSAAVSGLVMAHQSPGSDDGFDCFLDPGRVVCRWGDYSGAVPDPVAVHGATAGRGWFSNMDATGGGPNPLAPEWGTWNWALRAA
jgi:hypothetical protein